MIKKFITVIGSMLLLGGLTNQANSFEIDITSVLLADPKVARDIRDICDHACAGNERKSWLHQAVLDIRSGDTYSFGQVELRLRNKHKPTPWMTLYNHTETVRVNFRLHNDTCETEITSINASGFVSQVLIGIVDSVVRLISLNRRDLADTLGRHNVCPDSF